MTAIAIQHKTIYTAAELSNEDYHAAPGISCSGVKLIAEKTPLHFWGRYLGPRRAYAPKQPMFIGTATHAATLEPEEFERNYIVSPFAAKNAAGYKAWKEDQAKLILTPNEYLNVCGMRDALFSDPVSAFLLTDSPQFEVSMFAVDPITAATLRIRIDCLTAGGWIVDVKKCDRADDDSVAKAIGNYGYYIQDAFYRDVHTLALGVEPAGFVFLFVEEEPPHAINVVQLEIEDLERGRFMWRRGVDLYAKCLAANKWPGYAKGAHRVPMKSWTRQQVDRLKLQEDKPF